MTAADLWVRGRDATWLVQRAVLALALMLGFYILAIVIALALLWIPFGELMYLHRIDVRVAVPCLGGGLAILWALLPRADNFEPPGPRLEESSQPALFRVIREVAAATGQAEPADVYLLNEVNAFVAHRGGTMGFGSRRVMGIGLPLLQALSVDEFKAIIAHEFGHYSSGDVTLGPWVYKTRAAIGRAIEGVHGTVIAAPFQWYGRQFLRLTHAVSRQQEFIADQVAARVAGAANLASALRRVTGLTPAYALYLDEEVLPVLQAGFLPPVVDGFKAFLGTEKITGVARRFVEHAESHDQTNAFDTHPRLRDRLAALGAAHNIAGVFAIEPASTLIDDPEAYVRPLLKRYLGIDAVDNLKPIDWTRVAESVFAMRWRAVAEAFAQWLEPLTADAIPSGTEAFVRIGSSIVRSNEPPITADDAVGRAVFVLSAGLGRVMLDLGWKPSTSPGMPMILVRGAETFEPLRTARELAEGVLTQAGWKAQCERLGITGVPLGQTATAAVVS